MEWTTIALIAIIVFGAPTLIGIAFWALALAATLRSQRTIYDRIARDKNNKKNSRLY